MVEKFQCRCGHIFSPKIEKVVKHKKGTKLTFDYDSLDWDCSTTRVIRRFIFWKREETTHYYKSVRRRQTYTAKRDLCERRFECGLCGALHVFCDYDAPDRWRDAWSKGDYEQFFDIKEKQTESKSEHTIVERHLKKKE